MDKKTFDTIPVMDMHQYVSNNQSDRDQFVQQLREASHHVGFFYLKNHGINSALMKQVLALTKAFFNLPQNEKNKISIFQSPHYRGYGKLNAETTLGVSDYKETYDLGLERNRQQVSELKPYLKLHGPNQWPDSRAMMELHFKEVILHYLELMQQLGCQLMRAMSQALGMPSDGLANHFNPSSADAYAMLRLLHYPPAINADKNVFGVGPHVDAGCLVFLLQDNIGGLQVQNHNKQWIDAPPVADRFIVNIGQMLQTWSNHYFKATPHRVLNTTNHHRYSAPFFFEPNLSAVVKGVGIGDESAGVKGIIYGEHMLRIFERSFVG